MSELQNSILTQESLSLPTSSQGGTNKPQKDRPRVLIVGAGFGGLRAAKALRNVAVHVTVIDKQNHHLFQPLLYWVATAGLSPADITSPIRTILKRQKNGKVLMAEVTGVDLEKRLVLMDGHSEPYDYLVLATGAHDHYFGHPEWGHYALGLKSVVDAITIRRRILLAFEAAEMEADQDKVRELLTFVLVGAGPTGVEMAGAIAELAHKALPSDFRHIDTKQTRIILVEAAPYLLATFPQSLASKTRNKLERMGIEVRTGKPVTLIDEHGVVVDGELIKAHTVIWSAGVSASPAGKWLGIETDRVGRVKVRSDLSIANHPNVFVIGDTASVQQDGKLLPGVAPVAMQAGRYVASVIAQDMAGKDRPAAFHYHNKGNLATVGRSYAIVEIGKLQLTGLIAWLMWLVVHIYYLIGFRNRMVAMFQWAWTYLTYSRGARLIIFEKKQEHEQA